MPKQEIVEATVSDAEDTREWALERLKVLSRLSPWRLLRHFLSTRTAVDMDTFFDEFQCAASMLERIKDALLERVSLDGGPGLNMEIEGEGRRACTLAGPHSNTVGCPAGGKCRGLSLGDTSVDQPNPKGEFTKSIGGVGAPALGIERVIRRFP